VGFGADIIFINKLYKFPAFFRVMSTDLGDLVSLEAFERDLRTDMDGDFLVMREECAKFEGHNLVGTLLVSPKGYLGSRHTPNLTSPLKYRATLRLMLSKKERFTPSRDRPVFYDLGCGIGTMVIYGAHDGWYGLGTEFDKDHFEGALENMGIAAEASFIDKNHAMVAYGSFFPEGFEIRQDSNGMDMFRWYLQSREEKSERIDIQRLFNFNLSEVDLFYHYQVELKDNILRFFAEYAKKGALLMFVPIMDDKAEMPKGVESLGLFHSAYLFQKV